MARSHAGSEQARAEEAKFDDTARKIEREEMGGSEGRGRRRRPDAWDDSGEGSFDDASAEWWQEMSQGSQWTGRARSRPTRPAAPVRDALHECPHRTVLGLPQAC